MKETDKQLEKELTYWMRLILGINSTKKPSNKEHQ